MARKNYDWELIEIAYRTPGKSIRQIARDFGCCEKAIRKKAIERGWIRDLSDKIKVRACDLVIRNGVAERSETHAIAARATEKQIIEACAQTYAEITVKQRESINKSQLLYEKLHAELTAQTDEPEPKNLSVRIDCFKKLIESQKTVIGLQRLVYGMSDNADGDAPAKPVAIEPGGDFVNAMLERLRSKHESS